MANITKASASVAPSYVEYEPISDWQKEEGIETLIIHLPDFKKEQLRVQVNNHGFLKISGDRPVTEDGTKRSRFLKEIKIPQGCDIYDIRAAFKNGCLYITMPKKLPTPPQEQPASTSSAPQAPNLEDTQKPKPDEQVPSDNDPKAPTTNAEDDKMGTMTSDDKSKDQMFGLGSSLARLQVRKKVAVNFGIAVVVMVAIGAYVAYKCGSNPSCSYVEDLGIN